MENNLSHAGIKGMKWGKRRYQNPDGSLTPEGKLRYHEDYIRVRETKDIRNMSDKELRDRINRFQMEEQYARYAEKYAPTGKTRAKKFFKAFGGTLSSSLKKGGTALIDSTIQSTGRTIGEKLGTAAGKKGADAVLAKIGKMAAAKAAKKSGK